MPALYACSIAQVDARLASALWNFCTLMGTFRLTWSRRRQCFDLQYDVAFGLPLNERRRCFDLLNDVVFGLPLNEKSSFAKIATKQFLGAHFGEIRPSSGCSD